MGNRRIEHFMVKEPPNHVPAHAEVLDIFACSKLVDVPSQFVPGAMARRWRFVCPKCQAERDPPPAMTTVQCAGCALYFHHDARGWHVWRYPNFAGRRIKTEDSDHA